MKRDKRRNVPRIGARRAIASCEFSHCTLCRVYVVHVAQLRHVAQTLLARDGGHTTAAKAALLARLIAPASQQHNEPTQATAAVQSDPV